MTKIKRYESLYEIEQEILNGPGTVNRLDLFAHCQNVLAMQKELDRLRQENDRLQAELDELRQRRWER